jgi:hypothetical protein
MGNLIIAVAIVIVLLLGGAARAMAYDEDRAWANVVGDYSSCAAFYAVCATCIGRTDFGPDTTPEQLQSLPTYKAYQEALRQSFMVMRPETAAARFKLYFEGMNGAWATIVEISRRSSSNTVSASSSSKRGRNSAWSTGGLSIDHGRSRPVAAGGGSADRARVQMHPARQMSPTT